MTKSIGRLEEVLRLHAVVYEDPTPFLGAIRTQKPKAVDFLVWPWLERLEALCMVYPGELWC